MTSAVRTGLLVALGFCGRLVWRRRQLQPAPTAAALRLQPVLPRRRPSRRRLPSRPARTPSALSIAPSRPIPNGDAITYGAIGGADAARFTMNPVTREVRFAAQPDFEAPTDTGGNNVYDISFTASDGANTVTQNVAITVTNTGAGFRVRRVASGMSAPIFAAGLPDGTGRVVVVERGGRIRVLNPTTGAFEATDFLNLPADTIDTAAKRACCRSRSRRTS